ncbi:hypothetical protein FRB96_003498 [Tulasnella sp. 330]|nr:hypothetical protein FRB96_003498 [Tulasnella sp. 330]
MAIHDSPMKSKATNDAALEILGSVGRLIPTSPFLERLARYISTYGGSDKVLTVLQYTLKLLVPFMEWRARLQHSHGKRARPISNSTSSLVKLIGLIGDSQMLFRLLGLLPTMNWASGLEKDPNPNPRLLAIERLQALSMLIYYPLDNFYFFGKHSLYPMTTQRQTNLSLWATRAWAAYVALSLLHLREDVNVLEQRGQTLRTMIKEQKETKDLVVSTGPSDSDIKAEYQAIKKKRSALVLDFIANLFWFPQAVHWSLEKGFFGNEHLLSVFGFIANIASFKKDLDALA